MTNTARGSTRTKRLQVISAKVSAEERAVVESVAALAGDSLSSVVREMLRAGARARLRALTVEPPQGAGP